MGIIHYAYFLDTITLRRGDPTPDQIREGISSEELRRMAVEAVETSSGLGKDFLEAIGFDPNWLSLPTPDAHRGEELLKAWVAKDIRGHHELSLSSFAILEVVLPLLGWPEGDIRLLLVGRQLKHLAENLGVAHLLPPGPSRDPTSWLQAADAPRISEQLARAKRQFLQPDAKLLDAAKSACPFAAASSCAGLLAQSFFEIHRRFSDAAQLGFDMLLVNDIGTPKLDKSQRLDPL